MDRVIDLRPAVVVAGSVLAALAGASGWYGSRAVLFEHLTVDRGIPPELLGSTFVASEAGALLGAALVMGLGAAAGAWLPVIVGAVLTAAMLVALPAVPEATLLPVYGLAGAGRAMLSIGLFAVVADHLRGVGGWRIVAGAAGVYGALNLAALVSSTAIPAALPTLGTTVVFVGAAGSCLLAGAVAGATWAGVRVLGRSLPADPTRAVLHVPALVGGATVALVGGVLAALSHPGWEITWYVADQASLADWLMGANPAGILLLAGITLVVGLALPLVAPNDLAPVPAGLGLALSGVAVVCAWVAPLLGASTLAAGAAVVAQILGEGLFAFFFVAAWGRGLSWRLVPVVAGLAYAPTTLTALVFRGLALADIQPFFDWGEGVKPAALTLAAVLMLGGLALSAALLVPVLIGRAWWRVPEAVLGDADGLADAVDG